MKMQMALYKSTQYGYVNAHEFCDWMEKQTDSVRISEPIEVDFPPRNNREVIDEQVASLKIAAAEIEAKAYDAVQNIKARIRELQCLPAPESV
jgi:hypothetical protein